MSLRPTSKYIIKHTDNANLEAKTRSDNQRVQLLKLSGQSCLTCDNFRASGKLRLQPVCNHPTQEPKNKQVKHYNICYRHSASAAN